METKFKMLRIGLVVAILITTFAVFAEAADYVLKNGAVYTIDSKHPKAEAVALTGKKIVYVGNNKGVEVFIGKNIKDGP